MNMTIEGEKPIDDRETGLFKSVNAVENVNAELLNSLKMCIDLLTPIRGLVTTPEQWDEMMGTFEEVIEAAKVVPVLRAETQLH